MPKLKSLRGSIGAYGRVSAGGIVEVSEPEAEKLLKTKRFVRATDADIAAAKVAQDRFLAAGTGAGAGFPPFPEASAAADRAVEAEATPAKARK